MSLKKLFQILLGIQFALGIGLAILTFSLFLNQEKLSRSQDVHFQSYLLADELRQSSDDLTRLARTYVATGNEKYERQYWAVLDIRNGKSPRPVDYNRIYWDFVSGTGQKPRPDGAAISLRELMIREGFTDAELEKLTLSQKYSDGLVKTEKIAMNAVKGLFDDGAGNFTVKKEPDRALAIKLMTDEAYHKHKVSIMKPIDEFYAMFAERTAGDVAKYERRSMNLLLSMGVLMIVIMGMFGYCFVIIRRQITQRELVERELRESEEQYRTLVENANDIVFRLDETGHITFVNPAALRIMGYEENEIIGRHYPTFIRTDMQEEAVKFFGRQFVKGIPNTYSEYPVIVKDGREIWLGQSTQLIFHDGKVVAFQAVARDMTDRKQAEEELRRNRDVSERLAQEMAILAEIGKVVGSTLDTEGIYERFAAEVRKLIPFDRLSVNLHDLDQGILRVVYVSGEDIAGRKPGDLFPLKGSVSEVLVRTRAGMFSHPLSVEEMDKRFPNHSATIQAGMRSLLSVPLISRGSVIASLHFRSRQRNVYTEQDLRLAERIGEQIAGAIANSRLYAGLKETEKALRESERKYRELSMIDDLTRLYNSRHFYFQLKIELDRANRYEQPLTLLLLDLDNFKAFNDTFGHVEGDRVLRRLGQMVKRCLRETDFAFRYGGEEFTIVLPMTASADGAVTAERIRTEFKKEAFSPAPGQDVHMTVSIGLAQYKPQEEMKAFVHRADQLMYQGKKNGKDRVCCDSSSQEQSKGQSSIQFDIDRH